MSNWKQGLDRYLTQGPPDDGFGDYFEAVTEALTAPFYQANENWVVDGALMPIWASHLFDGGKTPAQTAAIIERAHAIYIKQKPHG